MLIGKKPSTIFDKLDELDIVFYPTGSRYLTPDRVSSYSDYDFYTEASEETVEALLSLGFQKLPSSSYQDGDLVAVYRYRGGPQVDVQLSRNVELRKEVNERIKALKFPFNYLSESAACEVWNAMFKEIIDGNS